MLRGLQNQLDGAFFMHCKLTELFIHISFTLCQMIVCSDIFDSYISIMIYEVHITVLFLIVVSIAINHYLYLIYLY